MALHEDNGSISAFRGLPFLPTKSVKRGTKGAPMSAKSLGEKFLSKLKVKNDDAKNAVFSEWNSCIPQNFAGKCAPQSLRLNVLYVSVCNGAVRQELLFNERAILKKLNALKGCAKIKKIRFI